MRFITDEEVQNLLTLEEAVAALREAFMAFGEGKASNLSRERTHCGGTSLSAMGAVLSSGVLGAKVYPTIRGKFNFCVTLFSSESGELLAVIQGNALTALRTSAASILAAQHLANPDSSSMVLFGSGQQAAAHAHAFASSFDLRRIAIVDSHGRPEALASSLAGRYGIEAAATDNVRDALQKADIVVTATRSTIPLFDGADVRPGTFVAAIGSSKPDARELDDTVLSRCASIVVEDRTQALREAGELVLASSTAFDRDQVVDLGSLVCPGLAKYQRSAGDITLYKSVGIGLEDIALARAVWLKVTNRLLDTA